MQPQALLSWLQSNQSIPAFLDLYGGSSEDQTAYADRAARLVQRYQAVFPDSQDISLFSSPGRTEVGGNHTDHNAGRVLAAAVNLDVLAAAGPADNPVIEIDSKGYHRITVDLNRLEPIEREKGTSTALVRGICSRLKQLGYTIGGFNACLTSNVPNGSGLSSSAAFEMMIVTILNEFYNQAKIGPVQAAQIGQFAENNYFGKPSGLMDQTTCAVGGFVTIDFKDFANPVVHKVNFDFSKIGYSLAIIGTGGSHADLTEDYSSIEGEMKSVARALGGKILREFNAQTLYSALPNLRGKVSDRGILRAFHFFADDARVVEQVKALEKSDFQSFLKLVIESGRSSWELNQNIYSTRNVHEQGIAIALVIAESILKGQGAWRVHGGGFAGTIQAFVPSTLVDEFMGRMSAVFGIEHCHLISIRPVGATKVVL